MGLGWGGQILVSQDLQKIAVLPKGAQWQDLGLNQIKDLPEPQYIFCLLHPDLKIKEFPPLKSLSNRPHNLPTALSPFVGRARELKDLSALLSGAQARLITLLGGGGTGKSRLGAEAALENLSLFKHGAAYANLGGMASADELPSRLLQALKVTLYRQKTPKDQLLEYLKDKNLLLVLDSCENLGAAKALVPEILEACPGVKVLACSRRRLNPAPSRCSRCGAWIFRRWPLPMASWNANAPGSLSSRLKALSRASASNPKTGRFS
jgi:hypothetical protein